MKTVVQIIIILVVLFILLHAFGLGRQFVIGKKLASNSQPFFYVNETSSARVLIVGDSTAVGVGATDPNQSIAGRFHQEFPKANIVNKSKSGSKLNEIVHQLRQLDQAENQFDFVLIQGGANDIVYFTGLSQAKEDLAKLVLEAKKFSNNVVVLVSGNIGLAPIFRWPLSSMYEARSKKYLASFAEVAAENDAAFVPLFREKKDDVLITDVKKYYATDGFHLSGAGYKIWYDELRKTMLENGLEF